LHRFSSVECSDPSLPFHLIHGFIVDAEYEPTATRSLHALHETQEIRAMVDLVSRPPFAGVLTIEVATNTLMFDEGVSNEDRHALSALVASRTGGIE